MMGNKLASFLVTFLVLVVWADNTIANNMNFVQKDEASEGTVSEGSSSEGSASEGSAADEFARAAEFLEKVNFCLEKCETQDPKMAEICPNKCMLSEVATRKEVLEEIITHDKKAAQGLLCMVGCEGSLLCHEVNTVGEFS